MSNNGEWGLQGWVPALTCLDIGANVGDWTAALARRAALGGRPVVVHAFEPAPATFQALARRVAGLGEGFHAHGLALTDQPGQLLLHVLGPNLGRNSLLPPLAGEASCATPVAGTSIDAFMAQRGIGELHLVKCDAEGHDARVLQGGRAAFAAGRIRVFQFEYNQRWIQARCFLRDVFGFIEGLPYRLGRLGPDGIEWLPGWHPELERFFEANYVLAHEGVADRLPGGTGRFDRFNTCVR
jgi:FkbM family methyltransferase